MQNILHAVQLCAVRAREQEAACIGYPGVSTARRHSREAGGVALGWGEARRSAWKRLTQFIDIRTWLSVWKLGVIISPSLSATSFRDHLGRDFVRLENCDECWGPCGASLHECIILSCFPICAHSSLNARASGPSGLSWSSPIILADERTDPERVRSLLHSTQRVGPRPGLAPDSPVSPDSYSPDNTMPDCAPFNSTASSWTSLYLTELGFIRWVRCSSWGTSSLGGRVRLIAYLIIFQELKQEWVHA